MVGHIQKRATAACDFAREAAQLENGGGREAAAERLVEQQLLRLTKIASWTW